MKKIILILASIVLQINVYSQWEKVYTNTTWANGTELYSHKTVLFQVGFTNTSHQTLRSSDNGTTWTDISSSFPYTVFHMLSYGNTVLAVTTTLGTTKYSFYASTDDGVTWAEKSNIDRGIGNGAILSIASDGNSLYAVSNRRSIYKSTDNGGTWVEIIIKYPGTSAILSFAASGNTYLAVLEGVGTVLSTDAGLNWTLKNSTSSIDRVYKINSDIWGFAGFAGIYKYNLFTNAWENNYLPGSFYLPISIASNGTQLISSFSGFLTSDTRYYLSNDNGTSWSELTTEAIGLDNKILSRYALAVNGSYYFAAYWKFASRVITGGVYRLPLTMTSLMSQANIPYSFQLSQNYPNPFNPETTISYELSAVSNVNLKVYDLLGKEVATLVNEVQQPGVYNVKFSINSLLSTGNYFYKLQAGNFTHTKKMLFLK